MRGRNKQHGNRAFRDDALGDVHVRAVFEKRGIQRAEGIALRVEIAAQVLFDRSGIARDLRCEIAHRNAGRQIADRGKRVRKAPVHEYEPAADAGDLKLIEILLRGQGTAVADKAERSLRDRRRIREAPILVARGWEAGFAEAREAILAQLSQPREIVARGGFFESAEAFRVFLNCWACRCHSSAPHFPRA